MKELTNGANDPILDFEKALLLLFVIDPPETHPLTQERQIAILANMCFDRDKDRARLAFEEAERRGLSASGKITRQ